MTQETAVSLRGRSELDRKATARILARAVRAGASIELCVLGDTLQIACSAAVTGESGGILILSLLGSEAAIRAVTQADSLNATLAADGQWYGFKTQRADDSPGESAPAMTIRKPVTMTVADRRRSPRRRLRGAAWVSLETSDGTQAWRGQAALLNLSMNGLACRVAKDDAEALQREQSVQVTFRAAERSESFELTARVTNVTEGTPGRCVLGLEFIDDERLAACRTRLHAVAQAGGQEASGEGGT